MIDKFLSIILIVLVASSCSEDGQTMDVQDEIPQADVEALQALGFSGSDGYLIESVSPITNQTYMAYLMERDIEIPLERLHEMAAVASSAPGGRTEQYRTRDFIRLSGSSTRSHNVVVSEHVSRNSIMGRGIQAAFDNYNNLGLAISFRLFFEGESTNQGFDIGVHVQPNLLTTGGRFPLFTLSRSKFPDNNRAGDLIRLSSAAEQYGQDFVERLVTHAIGHNIGFRHTDWFDNSISCDSRRRESEGPLGAFHIPGTPARTNVDTESIMLSCIPTDTREVFSEADKRALQFIYGIRVDD